VVEEREKEDRSRVARQIPARGIPVLHAQIRLECPARILRFS
jgi:hypothetical protein